jgi:hypothetical protein
VGVTAGSQTGMDQKGEQSAAGSGKAATWERKRYQVSSKSPMMSICFVYAVQFISFQNRNSKTKDPEK